MNKHALLVKKLITTGIIFLIIVAVAGGLFYATDSMNSSQAEEKTNADNAVNALQGEISNMKMQLDKSGEAEKGFAVIQLSRSNLDFTANKDTLRDILRASKVQYRFSNTFKLNVAPEKLSDKSSQISPNYAITLRPNMKLEFDAISDIHVFSFIDDLVRKAPGLIRIEGLTLKRKGEMDPASIADMQRGGAPYLVEAAIDFSWIGIAPITKTDKPTTGAGQ